MKEKTANKKDKSGQQTLFMSVFLSSPGVVVVALGLIVGRSSTQLADFIRRSAELVAMIVSWLMYLATHKEGQEVDEAKKTRLELIAKYCVGAAMCLSGLGMLLVSFLSFGGEKGNVIGGLIIAVLGVTTNSWFWYRYSKLNKTEPNMILAVQSKLYRAKSLVDICVFLALATIMIAPGTVAATYMDVAGSVIVSIYLIYTGITTLFGKKDEVS